MKFVLAFLAAATASAAPFAVGQKDLTLKDASRNRTLKAYVWYPIYEKISMPTPKAKGNPFLPVVALKDGPMIKVPEKFPVVLLSHGSGGTASKLFWITEGLVKSGKIVIAVDHTGNMTGDSSADGMMRIWERPRDLTFALDQITSHPHFKNRLDLEKVGAVGHSAGGTTVLMLAGGKLSHSQLQSPIPHCAGTKDPYFAKACEEVKKLDLKAYPKDIVEADYTDKRVKAVVALDPGFARIFKRETLGNLSVPSLTFIADKLNSPHDEIYSKGFLQLLPQNSVAVTPGSYHMTFIQACKPDFDKSDPELKELCVDNDRKIEIQKKVFRGIERFFDSVSK